MVSDPYAVLGVEPPGRRRRAPGRLSAGRAARASRSQRRLARVGAALRGRAGGLRADPRAAHARAVAGEPAPADRLGPRRVNADRAATGTSGPDPGVDARLAELERQLAEARAARERARRPRARPSGAGAEIAPGRAQRRGARLLPQRRTASARSSPTPPRSSSRRSAGTTCPSGWQI